MTLLAAGAVVGGYAGTDAVRAHRGEFRPPPAPTTPAAYRQAGAPPSAESSPSAAPRPSADGVARQLADVVSAPGLGARLRARVVDAATGAVLYDRGGAKLAAPASTAKLLTAAALLLVHKPTDTISTRVVAGPGDSVVLVGGGDPTLTAAPESQPGAYPQAARIGELAAQLRRAGLHPSRIVVDDSLFSGPAISPDWAPEDVPSEYASAITAAMVDGGRSEPDAVIRSAQPDLAAGHALAAALHQPQLPVSRGHAPSGTRALASVSSAPYRVLVEQMLQNSDNVIAECLARQVALAVGRPASFTGSAAAIGSVLAAHGVDPGAGMLDGSGLAAGDRLSAATLTGVLRLVIRTPQLRPLLDGLPVAAWSGSLRERYLRGSAEAGAGLVRAKTGTLTGVSSLAGTVHDKDGRLLLFALIADRVQRTEDAEAALDAIATRLSGCGCR